MSESLQTQTPRSIAVILSTYEQPRWLEKVLWGYGAQSDRDFALFIADDGSGDETRSVVRSATEDLPFAVHHVWHEDDGFRKCTILNRALERTEADYVIFSDGDCIPPPDFVALHRRLARDGRFLSGSYFKLPRRLSEELSREDVESGSVFSARRLWARGLTPGPKLVRVATRGSIAGRVLDRIVSLKRITWNGHNSSAWRRDLLAVNGFDERMGYYGEDREMGLRMQNRGIRPHQLRYRCCCFHLDHGRPYRDDEMRRHNLAIRERTVREKRVWTEHGIVAGPEP